MPPIRMPENRTTPDIGERPGTNGTPANDLVLKVEDLRTYFDTDEGEVHAVNGVSLSVKRGSTLALVGESGCGKSVTAYSILRLIRAPGHIAGGRIVLYPRGAAPIEVTALRPNSDLLYEVRGKRVGMIFQEPMSALSPVHTIGNQIREAVRLHHGLSKTLAQRRAVDMLRRVGIPAPEDRVDRYPFELSGGMRQRAVIAMALASGPELLIADEPTTALDVTIQAQIMGLLKDLQREMGTSILLITHDLAVVAQMADEVAVMYLGRVVERAPVRALVTTPRHPYTMGLLESRPDTAPRHQPLSSIPGSVPSVIETPPGCPFHRRCPFAQPGRCDVGNPPPLRALNDGRAVACVRAEEIARHE